MTHITDTGRMYSASNREVTLERQSFDQEILRRVTGLVSLGVGILNSLILLRFFLNLMGANQANAFARFVAASTDPILSIFQDLMPTLHFNGMVFEFSDLIAIAVFGLAAWIFNQLLRVMFAR